MDGSVIEARVWCCGGMTKSSSPEIGNSKVIFVPKGIHISHGDIVEVRSGTPASKQNRENKWSYSSSSKIKSN